MSEVANNEVVLRCQFEAYMLCGEGNSAEYKLIGEGFTSFPESKNPKEYTRKYVNSKTEKTDVIGYSPSIAYSCDVIAGDPVVDEIKKITDNEYVGSATHRKVVTVNTWDEIDRYFKTTDVALASGKDYYTKAGDVYTKVENPVVGSIATYYEHEYTYPAFEREYAVVPSNKGDGTDTLIYTGTLKACSDLVKGTFNRTTKEFTAE